VVGEGRRAKGRELRVNNCAGRNVKKKKEGQIVDPTPKSLNIKECHKITNTQKLTKFSVPHVRDSDFVLWWQKNTFRSELNSWKLKPNFSVIFAYYF